MDRLISLTAHIDIWCAVVTSSLWIPLQVAFRGGDSLGKLQQFCMSHSYMSTTHCPSSRSRNENFADVFPCPVITPSIPLAAVSTITCAILGVQKYNTIFCRNFWQFWFPIQFRFWPWLLLSKNITFQKYHRFGGSFNLHSKAKFRADPDTVFVFDLYWTYQCYTLLATALFRDILWVGANRHQFMAAINGPNRPQLSITSYLHYYLQLSVPAAHYSKWMVYCHHDSSRIVMTNARTQACVEEKSECF